MYWNSGRSKYILPRQRNTLEKGAWLKESKMADTTKILVLYHSSYGHIETMAKAVAEGAASEGHRIYSRT